MHTSGVVYWIIRNLCHNRNDSQLFISFDLQLHFVTRMNSQAFEIITGIFIALNWATCSLVGFKESIYWNNILIYLGIYYEKYEVVNEKSMEGANE